MDNAAALKLPTERAGGGSSGRWIGLCKSQVHGDGHDMSTPVHTKKESACFILLHLFVFRLESQL